MRALRSRQDIKKAYFRWLCEKIDREDDRDYEKFLSDLHEKEFYGGVPNDDNRAVDGENLRVDFGNETRMRYVQYLVRPCSILEMLVGLALRMDYILFNSVEGERPDRWFWVLIKNLELLPYECDDPEIDGKRRVNNNIIARFLERRYDKDGKGGLFPLKNSVIDQRNVEIWYQMSAWINELTQRR